MPDRLAEIRARLDAATQLPVSPHSVTLFPIDRRRDERAERAFIAHAPADIAWLLALVDELEGRAPLPCGCVMGGLVWVTNCTEGHGEDDDA